MDIQSGYSFVMQLDIHLVGFRGVGSDREKYHFFEIGE